MTDYLKRLRSWLGEGRFLYGFILIIVITFALDNLNTRYETVDNVRFFGLILELIGTSTVVYSLKEKLQIFKGHGFSKLFMDYLKRFPTRKVRKTYHMKADAAAYAITMGNARLIRNPKEDLKEIIAYFQAEIAQIHNRFEEIEGNLRKQVKDLEGKIVEVKSNLAKEINETNVMIKESAVSNVWLEAFGLSCIVLGLILGTAPDLVVLII